MQMRPAANQIARARTRRLAPALAAVLLGALLGVPAALVSAGPDDFRYQVTPTASPHRDIPGTAVTFRASAGQEHYLWARKLSIRPVTQLQRGDNIGNTVAIQCRDADGRPLPAERGAYWATNLVPPGESVVTPTLRWLFVAPESGTFTCLLTVSSYSTIVRDGRRVDMEIPAGAELARAGYPHSIRWTLQDSDAVTIGKGDTHTTLGTTFTPTVASAQRIAVTQDAALTTCKAGSTIEGCSGGSDEHPGTTVRTWIEGQPQTRAGAPCGTRLRGKPVTRSISTAKHHLTATNTLYLTESQLESCAQVRLTLRVENVAGNPVRLHAGLALGGLAATHGVAFEHN